MLRLLTVWSCACFGSLLLIAPARSDEPALRWLRNLDEAKGVAATEHKDLFINFTGREWCGNCIALERQIFSRKEFASAEQKFVLVDLDFPSDREDLRELKEPYERWIKQYLVHGFPTVVLADASGRPYAYFTGHDNKVDAAGYIDRLQAAAARKIQFDAALAKASVLEGADRAKKLHAAIESVAGSLEGLSERHDDPVLVFYAKEVADIRRLDSDNALKLRELYDARVTARDNHLRHESIVAQVYKYETKEECPAALALIDKLLGEAADDMTRFRLHKLRVRYLETNEQHEDALRLVRELQYNPLCSADDRERFFRDETNYLLTLDRLDEAIQCCDRQIAAAKAPDDRFHFLQRKVEVLLQANDDNRRAEIVAASLAAQAVTKANTEQWADATSNVGWAYRRAGQLPQAIAAFQAADHFWHPNGPDAEGLMFLAELQHEQGQDDLARKSLDQAEKILPTKTTRLIQSHDIQILLDELKRVREIVGPAASK